MSNPLSSTVESEKYTPGYTTNAVSFMRRRTVQSHGAFVIPHLKRGMRILDCGCGPGTITRGIAELVATDGPVVARTESVQGTPLPGDGLVQIGQVIGIDRGAEQLAEAGRLAREEGLPATFETGDVYRLAFPRDIFDGVFSHALFEHLARPVDALREIHRVLKPGGFVALRSPDWGGFMLHPWEEPLQQAIAAYIALQTRNGGDVHAGRKLTGWMRAAGFAKAVPSASYEIYSDTHLIAEFLAQRLSEEGDAVSAEAIRQWAQHPDALFVQPWLEGIGWKGVDA
ncbi:MAG: methyltransferase domain-containing protein [Candidatus Methylacidiphilales bacterium]|nr:methyltransferase domain-containing protein [Candidatus Methylacidiphilales bacterium]